MLAFYGRPLDVDIIVMADGANTVAAGSSPPGDRA